jgi:hypothetical protein
VLFGFLPEGEDPVAFCNRMADFFGTIEGPTGEVAIHVVRSLNTGDADDPLATGRAGGTCSAA